MGTLHCIRRLYTEINCILFVLMACVPLDQAHLSNLLKRELRKDSSFHYHRILSFVVNFYSHMNSLFVGLHFVAFRYGSCAVSAICDRCSFVNYLQLMRIGFDSEGTALSSRSVTRTVVEARYPAKIICGLCTDSDTRSTGSSDGKPQGQVTSVPLSRMTGSQYRSRKRDPTDVPELAAVLSRLRQSACCTEYSRLQLGSLNMIGSGTGDWRVSKVNLEYTICDRCVMVMYMLTWEKCVVVYVHAHM